MNRTQVPQTIKDLKAGGKAVMARALAAIEQAPDSDEVIRLLDEAWKSPHGHVLGLTGPPGVGKSTLIGSLIAGWRKMGRTVGVIAVDPSSRRTGGALLGDRTRLATDPEDEGIYVRSMAARDRLGGLAGLTAPAMILMRAVYDIVLVETVGVGQSETDVAGVADTVIFCIQPGSGDSLQFMKAGIMEVPHIMVVTKADMGARAERARADVAGALGLSEHLPAGEGSEDVADWAIPVLKLSAAQGEGLEELLQAVDDHENWLKRSGMLEKFRQAQGQAWLRESVREKYGTQGLKKVADQLDLPPGASPFSRLWELEHSGVLAGGLEK
ncbi:methylmalonyl Co-A mutase-associated GTPase MeaB [Luteithermobacter gelatinilyticus]|uniref:methylmalonyl Co-A mutase-associated GTPase MeaB n=1 Tax=Luteithermobacter gelatinilyticus TaxID=2582913 RepID=UPI00110578BF|nr:methylmalonyl Co-A mutase-associated GTPase MeaB [Luteithermobacter gelatinilyticus]